MIEIEINVDLSKVKINDDGSVLVGDEEYTPKFRQWVVRGNKPIVLNGEFLLKLLTMKPMKEGETKMNKKNELIEKVCEEVCNNCRHTNDPELDQEKLDAICEECEIEKYIRNITGEDLDNSIKIIAKHYGYESQSKILIEEMAELMVAINKLARVEELASESVSHCLDVVHCRKNIAEEIADVEIMLEQIKYLLMNEAVVDDFKEYKITRQLRRARIVVEPKQTDKNVMDRHNLINSLYYLSKPYCQNTNRCLECPFSIGDECCIGKVMEHIKKGGSR